MIAFFGWEYWQKETLQRVRQKLQKVQQLMDEANATADNPNALASITASADKIVKDDIRFSSGDTNSICVWQNLHMKNKIMLLLKKL